MMTEVYLSHLAQWEAQAYLSYPRAYPSRMVSSCLQVSLVQDRQSQVSWAEVAFIPLVSWAGLASIPQVLAGVASIPRVSWAEVAFIPRVSQAEVASIPRVFLELVMGLLQAKVWAEVVSALLVFQGAAGLQFKAMGCLQSMVWDQKELVLITFSFILLRFLHFSLCSIRHTD